MKDMRIFKELLIPFLLKLSVRHEEFQAFFENVISTSEMKINSPNLISEFMDCKY